MVCIRKISDEITNQIVWGGEGGWLTRITPPLGHGYFLRPGAGGSGRDPPSGVGVPPPRGGGSRGAQKYRSKKRAPKKMPSLRPDPKWPGDPPPPGGSDLKKKRAWVTCGIGVGGGGSLGSPRAGFGRGAAAEGGAGGRGARGEGGGRRALRGAHVRCAARGRTLNDPEGSSRAGRCADKPKPSSPQIEGHPQYKSRSLKQGHPRRPEAIAQIERRTQFL